MSKYLNVFNTLAEYQAFSASTEYVQPNVALVKETNVLYYDYGDNKPQVDMSNFKVESQEISVGGNYWGKSAITKINYIKSGVTSLSMEFQNWSSLKEVTCEIPSSVTGMGMTFQGCISLVTAPDIPSGVADMYSTFKGCSSLINAPVIPSSVTNIDYTFNGCKSIKEVTFLHTTPPTYKDTLSRCSSLESIYVPDSALEDYRTATGWSEFADKIKPLSSKPTE